MEDTEPPASRNQEKAGAVGVLEQEANDSQGTIPYQEITPSIQKTHSNKNPNRLTLDKLAKSPHRPLEH
ncbi:hypothetical protein GOV12_00115, partial [Candidatus Pacearchaeota archaeon]|nr:hypothetical protein [Candidatus Pacearchaeota archaeon]